MLHCLQQVQAAIAGSGPLTMHRMIVLDSPDSSETVWNTSNKLVTFNNMIYYKLLPPPHKKNCYLETDTWNPTRTSTFCLDMLYDISDVLFFKTTLVLSYSIAVFMELHLLHNNFLCFQKLQHTQSALVKSPLFNQDYLIVPWEVPGYHHVSHSP